MSTPFGRFNREQEVTVAEGDRRLAYFLRSPEDFDVLPVSPPKPPPVPRKHPSDVSEAPKATTTRVLAPEPPGAPPDASEEDTSPKVVGATRILSESTLLKLKRAELAELAEDEFGLDVGESATKREIVAAILREADEDEEDDG